MEKVVNRLSQIEAAAVAIMEEANSKKKEISNEMDLKTAEFDKKVDSETEKKLAKLTKNLQDETDQELNKLKMHAQKTLKALDDEYDKNHSIMANKIFSTMIRE